MVRAGRISGVLAAAVGALGALGALGMAAGAALARQDGQDGPRLTVSAPVVAAEPALARVGEPAPPLELAGLLQTPAGAKADWASLRGKAVVLEFWATWCGPCIAAFPHLNELAKEMQGEPVVFLAISDEPRETVEPFLKRRKLNTWVGLDEARKTFLAYEAYAIPRTVLVDKEGVVRGITHPMNVTPAMLRALVAGKSLGLEDSPTPGPAARKDAGEVEGEGNVVMLRAEVARTTRTDGMTRVGPRSFSAQSMAVRDVVGEAFGVPGTRVVFEGDVYQGALAVDVMAAEGVELEWRELLEMSLGPALNASFTVETRETPVLILARTEARPAPEPVVDGREMGGSTGSTQTRFEAVRQPVLPLARWLERRLGVPVIDRSGLEGVYDYVVEFEADTPAAADRALVAAVGLNVLEARERVDFVIVRPKPPSTGSAIVR